jgi:isopentenyl diphosphate isomerase/L-lactate dehydrogenase-like FMN-dependent dehydrogenase
MVDVAVDLDRFVALSDFEPVARERMDPGAYDYVAGGAWDEVSLLESVDAWHRYRFVPRVLGDLDQIDPSGSFLGRRAALPVAVAPMAFQELAHPLGELATVAGAAAGGVPYCLSTAASRTIEEVAAAAPDAERWFQLYFVQSFDLTRELVERAATAGYRALVVTVDLPVLGYRDRDRRSGFVVPRRVNVPESADAPAGAPGGPAEEEPLVLTWADLERIRSWSTMPLVVKGILSDADAGRAADMGVDALVVSTHGARQLDRVIATADALPGIVDTVGGRCEIWVDGGIRRGLDVLVALAIGATGVLVGRPLYWALATAGQDGVERALAILREEITIALPLIGVSSPAGLTRDHLAPPR